MISGPISFVLATVAPAYESLMICAGGDMISVQCHLRRNEQV